MKMLLPLSLLLLHPPASLLCPRLLRVPFLFCGPHLLLGYCVSCWSREEVVGPPYDACRLTQERLSQCCFCRCRMTRASVFSEVSRNSQSLSQKNFATIIIRSMHHVTGMTSLNVTVSTFPRSPPVLLRQWQHFNELLTFTQSSTVLEDFERGSTALQL